MDLIAIIDLIGLVDPTSCLKKDFGDRLADSIIFAAAGSFAAEGMHGWIF